MVPSTRWVRPSIVAFASLLALLVLLCAGGGAEAALVLVGHDEHRECGADDRASASGDCRAASLELPSLALPTWAVDLVRPGPDSSTVTAPAVAAVPQKRSTPSVPRSPPRV